MPALELFNQYRPLLFAIAYRMLGSVMDAEDMVQETFLRWERSAAEIESPKAYLTTAITRLCIDHLGSARMQRESYIGPWLPEPLATANDPGESAALAESLSVAFMVLLERLNPTDRAIFLLREAFGYDYGEIAAIVGKSEANCRQIARRARERVHSDRPRFQAPPAQVARLTEAFLHTCAAGDLDGLIAMLAEDATIYSDGGGKVTAARKPISGAEKVARFILGVLEKVKGAVEVRVMSVNGEPSIVMFAGPAPISVLSMHVADDRIEDLYLVVNPDKLAHLAAPPAGAS
ncbi:MAG TPA: RNA polymerase sigma-70 factor [Herpetosiphonaceae bacterium]